MTSSLLQLADTWSIMILSLYLPPKASLRASALTRIYRMITLLALILSLPLSVIPSPGAVCPAMVILPFEMVTSASIVPETLNTTVLGPFALTASAKLPGPEALRFVTSMTLPPRPPTVYFPYPSAVGNANCWAWSIPTQLNKATTNGIGMMNLADFIVSPLSLF